MEISREGLIPGNTVKTSFQGELEPVAAGALRLPVQLWKILVVAITTLDALEFAFRCGDAFAEPAWS